MMLTYRIYTIPLFNDNRLKIERSSPLLLYIQVDDKPIIYTVLIAITNPNNSFPHRISR